MTARRREQKLPPTTPSAHASRLLIGLLLWAVVHALAIVSVRPPAPLADDAPERHFSAGRAALVLDELLEGVAAHPMGSAANALVRERIHARLEWLGYQPEVQEAFATGPHGRCGTVRNVLARRQGGAGDPALLLVCHYDSVCAGPGVSDDMSGVAVMLEVARIVSEERRPSRTVMFLFTDGEEEGLLGARAFARDHPWMDDVGVVINLEARGASGPSYLFETGENDEWLLDVYGRSVADPSVTSVSTEVYRRMPNDTDFTVFRERGLAGLNFAFIDRSFAYHTPLDDREHLSLASVQHHGDQVVATLRELEESRARPRRGDAVVTSPFGAFVVGHSKRSAPILALLATLALLWGAQRATATGRIGWWRVFGGMCAAPVLAAAPVAAAAGVLALVRGGTGAPVPWFATPSPAWIAALGAIAATACLLVSSFRRIGTPALTHGVWIWWGLGGLLSALFVPGASFLFVWPALLFALLSNVVRLQDALEARIARIAIFAVVPVVALWAPVLDGVQQAFGLGVLALAGYGIVATLLVPLLTNAPANARRALLGVGVACVSFGCAMVFVLPHHSAQRPGRLNLVYQRGMSEAPSTWRVEALSGVLPPELAAVADFERSRDGTLYTADAPDLSLPAPTFELEGHRIGDDGRHHVRGRVRSPGGHRTEVWLQGTGLVERFRAAGVDLPSSGVSLVGVGADGVELEIVFRELEAVLGELETVAPELEELVEIAASQPLLEIAVQDRRLDLPPEASFLVEARPASFVPSHDGDGSVVPGAVYSIPQREE